MDATETWLSNLPWGWIGLAAYLVAGFIVFCIMFGKELDAHNGDGGDIIGLGIMIFLVIWPLLFIPYLIFKGLVSSFNMLCKYLDNRWATTISDR